MAIKKVSRPTKRTSRKTNKLPAGRYIESIERAAEGMHAFADDYKELMCRAIYIAYAVWEADDPSRPLCELANRKLDEIGQAVREELGEDPMVDWALVSRTTEQEGGAE